jgi:hypothetical protein
LRIQQFGRVGDKPGGSSPARDFQHTFFANGRKCRPVSESQRHPDVARLESQPRVEPLRIDAGVMREQLDELATLRTCLRNRPLQDLLADTAAAAMRGDTNVLDQAARGALRA